MKELFLRGSFLLALISFSSAYAEFIVCNPVKVGLVKSVKINSVNQRINTMQIQYMDNSMVEGSAFYGDDIDSVYYTSKKLNAQLDIFFYGISKNIRHGTFYRDYPGSNQRTVIEVLCKSN